MAAGRGPLTVLVEVGDLVPGLRLVQFHRARGDSIDFFQFYGALLPLVGRRSLALLGSTCIDGRRWSVEVFSRLGGQLR